MLAYQFSIWVYFQLIRLSARWNEKARRWVDGRKGVFEAAKEHIPPNKPLIWIHAASAGEFEQAKPVIETLRQQYPAYFILVSFFSPSGYKAATGYAHADYITYLPADSPGKAREWLNILNPKLVIFVKYDFWYFHLKTIATHRIPLLLISSIFRQDQLFFKRYGGFYRNMLRYFTHLFVQDVNSLSLLQSHGLQNSSISGDTRFDRVAAITQHFTEVPYIADFVQSYPTIVAGSTWEDDEDLLAAFAEKHPHYKLIIAPHEITVPHLLRLQQQFDRVQLYSEIKSAHDIQPYLLNKAAVAATHVANADTSMKERVNEAGVLIIDNVGMLSKLYHYGTICYIGGGFTKSGIHNSLEAAVYGRPVIFGPNYRKYHEAAALVATGGAFSIKDANTFAQAIRFLSDPAHYEAAAAAAKTYVQQQRGATDHILNYIQENRLLTN